MLSFTLSLRVAYPHVRPLLQVMRQLLPLKEIHQHLRRDMFSTVKDTELVKRVMVDDFPLHVIVV